MISKREIFLINAYTNSEAKEDILRDLITSIKRLNSKICLITHTSTSADIIKRCDYFIYDAKNPIVLEPQYQYWAWCRTSDFMIKYLSPKAKIHFLAYFRLILGGLRFLKTFGYDVVHSVDYDMAITSLQEFKENVELLEYYDVVAYTGHNEGKLTIFSANLAKVDDNNLIYDEDRLKQQYLELYSNSKYPLIENLLFDKILPQNMTNKSITSLERFASVNTQHMGDTEMNYDFTLFIDNDVVSLFSNNQTNRQICVEVMWKNNRKIIVSNQGFNIYPIDEISQFIGEIKLYVDDILYLKKESIDFFVVNSNFTRL